MPYEITISGINTKFNKCIDWVTCKVDTPATSNARTNYVGNYMNISGFIVTDEATIGLYQWAILPINESNVCRNVELTVKDANDNVIEKISFPNTFVQYYKESFSRDKGLGKFDLQLKQRIDKNGDILVSEAFAEEKLKSAVEEKKIENVLGKIPVSCILDKGTSVLAKSAEEGIPLTGVEKFDRLAVNTKEFNNWAANLQRRNISVKTNYKLPAKNPTNVLSDGTVEFNPEHFKYIDLLHESRHMFQNSVSLEQTGKVILKNKGWVKRDFMAIGEIEAYKYEMSLGERFGFSEEYMQYLKEMVSKYSSGH
ncbi:MAG TPA: hypothetical protein VF941_09845, partial [Clostridia bacterium]